MVIINPNVSEEILTLSIEFEKKIIALKTKYKATINK